MKKQLQLLALLFINAALYSSCSKEETVLKPSLSSELANGGLDTLSIGESLVLRPQIANKENVIFQWSVNGENKGTDSVFTFKPTERGDSKIQLKATNNGGELILDYKIHVYGKYENGFFIFHEGWMGTGLSSVSFYNYQTKSSKDTIYAKENPDKAIGTAGTTLQYGAIYGGKLYLVSKANGPLIKTDAYTLKEEGRVTGKDWRAIIATDANTAVVSTTSGLFSLNTETMTLGNKITTETGQIADLYQTDKYVYAVSQSKGLLVIDKTTLSISKTIAGIIGCAITPDKNVWAIGGTKIVKINSTTLEETAFVCPFKINGSWFAWHPASITASTKENAIFFEKTGSFNGSGTEIYKFSGDVASLNAPFAKIPSDKVFYGSMAYDKRTDNVLVLTVKSGWGTNSLSNTLYSFDSTKGGDPVDALNYTGYYFSSSIAFHN